MSQGWSETTGPPSLAAQASDTFGIPERKRRCARRSFSVSNRAINLNCASRRGVQLRHRLISCHTRCASSSVVQASACGSIPLQSLFLQALYRPSLSLIQQSLQTCDHLGNKLAKFKTFRLGNRGIYANDSSAPTADPDSRFSGQTASVCTQL